MREAVDLNPSEPSETTELPIVAEHELPRTSFILRVLEGPDAGSTMTLEPTSPPHAVLGHASSCALVLSDPHVSRRHVALTATPTHALLVDLGSRNGTFVNGVLVREARLYGGETVRIGRTLLGVETDRPAAANLPSTAPPPAPSGAPAPDLVEAIIAERLPFSHARARIVGEFERRYVEDLLARHGGNVTQAARASGVAHRYFQLVRARSRSAEVLARRAGAMALEHDFVDGRGER